MTDVCPKCASEDTELENEREAEVRCNHCRYLAYAAKFYSEKDKELAEFLHENYEEVAKETGWETQDGTSVSFQHLPYENKQVMLEIASRVSEEWL